MNSYDNLKEKMKDLEEINFELGKRLNNIIERHNCLCEMLSSFDFEKNTKEDTKQFIQWLLYHTEVELRLKSTKKE